MVVKYLEWNDRNKTTTMQGRNQLVPQERKKFYVNSEQHFLNFGEYQNL